MNKEKFDITGMTCSACSTRVEQCVRKLPGVSEVSVNLLKNSMVVSYDEHSLDTAGIVAAVENTGYGAIPQTSAPHRSDAARHPETAAANTAQAEYHRHPYCRRAVLHSLRAEAESYDRRFRHELQFGLHSNQRAAAQMVEPQAHSA